MINGLATLAAVVCRTALAQLPEEVSDQDAQRAAGRAAGLVAAQPVAPERPILSGVLGAGAPAGLGLAVGSLSALGVPVLGGLACGALGCVTVAWAWELAEPPPLALPSGTAAWQEGYAEGWAAGSLRARRRWVYLAGVATTAGLAGAYVGAAAWVGARGR